MKAYDLVFKLFAVVIMIFLLQGAPDILAQEETQQVTIVAVVPEDAPQVYLSGNLPELGPWHPAALPMEGNGAQRVATISVPSGHNLQFKVTGGSWEQEGLGPSGTVMPAFSLTVTEDTSYTAEIAGFRKDPKIFIEDWKGSGVEGQLVYWLDVKSERLKDPRHVVIWLPPGYEDSNKNYSVIYMHDGQNLFDPRIAYTNVDLGVDEAMMRGVSDGLYDPAIIVGIWNTAERLMEYSPWHDADKYADFVVKEIVPRVNEDFRVKTGPENTFTMGSSMGGLVSFYLVNNFPNIFGACGCVSSHVTWSPQMIEWFNGRDPTGADPTPYIQTDIKEGATVAKDVRMFFDYGTKGLDAAYHPTHQIMKRWLLEQGLEEGSDFMVKKYDGADHNEASWRERVGDQLAWLLDGK
ncbi:MAG: alpha/beta hydrolase-fold protein [Pseudomonadota bacterium]